MSKEPKFIANKYYEAEEMIGNAITENGCEPDDLLTDWHQGNVLVERLTTPVAGKNFKLWVIDQ